MVEPTSTRECMERYRFVEAASIGHSLTGNPWLHFAVQDDATGERVGVSVIFLQAFWDLLSQHAREAMARRLIDNLLQYEREQWTELPGWHRSDVPVLLEYEYFVPGPAAPHPSQN